MLVGHTLERATNGRLKAALHRVTNTNPGAARSSLVAKVRASRETRLDLAWALRGALEPGEVLPGEPLRVGDLLDNFAGQRHSINKVVTPITVPPMEIAPATSALSLPHAQHAAATTAVAGFGRLPDDIATDLLEFLDLRSRAACAGTSTWLRTLAGTQPP